MNHKDLKTNLRKELEDYYSGIATESGEWIVKGFIDIDENVYTISKDTKVISKTIEIMLFPFLKDFAKRYKYKTVPSKHQNHYPDMSFVAKDGTKIALDIKTTYRTSKNYVNGFTLGTFAGYFRDQKSNRSITFPYSEYSSHIVLGVIYDKSKEMIDEQKKYKVCDLKNMTSVISNLEFIIQEKWRIAKDKPGSGNTKNIGSCTKILELKKGNGVFAKLGEEVFNDYWKNFQTKLMAKEKGQPYNNIEEYLGWKKRGN